MPRSDETFEWIGIDPVLQNQFERQTFGIEPGAVGDWAEYSSRLQRQYDILRMYYGTSPNIQFVMRDRQKGKTTKLIYLAAKNNATIVTSNGYSVTRILEKAKDLGYSIKRPITYMELERKNSNGEKLLLDDVEYYLMSKFTNIIAMSMSVGDNSNVRLEEQDGE